ncbi:MAG TPA: hypothetical protein VHA52_06210, partial [Candidatus Babeliaceae bacterium]|nr:hypothetical protein [Candidatus Babeliaceae bacterium]
IKTGAKEADAFHREVSNVLGLPSERKAPMPTPSKKPRAKTTDEYSPAKRQKFSSEDLDEEAKKRKIDELTRLGEREYKKLQANGKNR